MNLVTITINYISLFLCFHNQILVEGNVDQCRDDCQSPLAIRPVGPTRPWHFFDDLGNKLELTRPYPYSIAGTVVSIVKFNITMVINGNDNQNNLIPNYLHQQQFNSFVLFENKLLTSKIQTSMFEADYNSFRVKIIDQVTDRVPFNYNTTMNNLQFVAQVDINAEHNGFNRSTISLFFSERLKPIILNKLQSSPYREEERHDLRKVVHRTFTFTSESSIEVVNELSVAHPNPYTAFCKIGCSLFYSFPNDRPVELVHCTDQCDDMYKYNISVGYNDLAEVARLECRDGCQMALKRCQPGYFCSQVKLKRKFYGEMQTNVSGQSKNIFYEGGIMNHCPAGTYRDVDFDSVEKCIPCPPGRFREDIKGRNLESCTKCPIGTFNMMNGSTSILDCHRCPAGTFTNQPGSENCICITPDACAKDQLPSPADAEKRNTIPYIGRW